MTEPGSMQDRWLDLALGQGPRAELDRLRQEVEKDPLCAIEFAETRDLIERMRGLAVEPSATFPERLEETCRRADARWVRRAPANPFSLLPYVAAASVLFLLLAWFDPLGLRRRIVVPKASFASPEVVAGGGSSASSPTMTAALARAAEAARRLEPDSQVAAAFARFASATHEEQLSDWLSARNALSLLRLEHELRRTADERRSALRDPRLPQTVDARVRALAADLAAEVEQGLDEPRALALSLRALVAAGERLTAPVDGAAERLSGMLPRLDGGVLAMALCALGEAAAATGRSDYVAVAAHGDRLVRSVLDVSDDVWSRRRPRLLQFGESAANLAAAGRFLRIAPALGVDADECRAVRLLLLAHLCERRDGFAETPDVPAAMVYGFGDLLDRGEREDLERRLRRWRPDGLVPDYLALQQLAATRSPDHLGFARWQLELRRVAALATPVSAVDRAALCLCLASGFADEVRGRALAGS